MQKVKINKKTEVFLAGFTAYTLHWPTPFRLEQQKEAAIFSHRLAYLKVGTNQSISKFFFFLRMIPTIIY